MATEHLHNPAQTDDMRGATDVEGWKRAFQRNLFCILGRFPATATANDKYLALAYSVRDHLLDRWVKTSETYYRKQVRTICYVSAEFLLGPHLGNNLLNLGALDTAKQAMEELGLDFDKLLDQEEEPGLGNPWEIPRPEIAITVGFGGHTEPYTDENGRYRVRWIPARLVKGIAYDTAILGYRVNTAKERGGG